jgi:hypothetical protein
MLFILQKIDIEEIGFDGNIINWDNKTKNWDREGQNMIVMLERVKNPNNITLEFMEKVTENKLFYFYCYFYSKYINSIYRLKQIM